MKYPQQISMPSGIQLWLEEQLEARGIDSRVYSNYILSVLASDSSELSVKPKDRQVRTLIDELRAKLKGLQEKGQFPKSFGGDNPQSLQEEGFSYYSSLPPSNSKPKPDQINSSLGSSPGVWSGKRAFGSSVGKNRTLSEGYNRESKFNNFNWLEEDKENNGCNRDVKEKMRSRSTVKQQTPDKNRNMAKSLDRKEDVNRRPDTSKSRRLYQQSIELPNDGHAFWKNEKSVDDLTGCDQDLPMDFQQLLESPESTKMSFDYSRLTGSKQPPSFIQCGTNITSSIWSEKVEDKMECSMIGETNNNVSLNMNLDKSPWGGLGEASINKAPNLQDSGNIFNNTLWGTGDPCASWKTVGACKAPIGDVGKWSDVEGTSLLLNDADNFFSSIGSNLHCRLTTLNHNKEDSSFTEVIPKAHSGFTVAKEIVNVEPSSDCNESTLSKKEDEDLFTSSKTHFRPIKQEPQVIEVVSTTDTPTYPDGATFPISNHLDEANFHRSPGGGLYLESDLNTKYMEYSDAKDNTPSEFVPKFRVQQQNEKFCQTEEFVPSVQDSPELESEEMYFPEDEKLVRSMVEEDEIDVEEENVFWSGETCIKVDGWMATWPTSGIWSNKPNVQEIWCGGNVVWNSAGEPPSGRDQDQGEQYTQLRNEWTQEAEELLSDISHQLYLADYVDNIQPPKMWEMARADSGNETLFSEESSPEIPPSADTPPRITGALTKGKIVIRPVAFKPVSSARFTNHGERYGSTPILARPGSHLTLYGSSNDLLHNRTSNSNFSLDRKAMSPSPLALSSLPLPSSRGRLVGYDSLESVSHKSKPRRLVGYDSLESVHKTSSARSQHLSRMLASEGSGTPSPVESGVMAELEAALRERDSEVAYLRQTMEHNEQVIFRVYQEKERAWEREMRRTKTLHENRLRAAAQKSHKLEQMLMMQTYQLQQDKKRLREDLERTERENSELRQEVDLLRSRLEETEWGLCQKSGELALLKSQLKETQGEQATKGHEVISLKSEVRDLRLELDQKSKEINILRIAAESRKQQKAEIDKLNIQIEELTAKLEMVQKSNAAKESYIMSHEKENGSQDEIEVESLQKEVLRLKEKVETEHVEWEKERVQWAQEKEKVLSYQRQLQLNYVQMYRRNRTLETQIQGLTQAHTPQNRTKVVSLNAIQL